MKSLKSPTGKGDDDTKLPEISPTSERRRSVAGGGGGGGAAAHLSGASSPKGTKGTVKPQTGFAEDKGMPLTPGSEDLRITHDLEAFQSTISLKKQAFKVNRDLLFEIKSKEWAAAQTKAASTKRPATAAGHARSGARHGSMGNTMLALSSVSIKQGMTGRPQTADSYVKLKHKKGLAAGGGSADGSALFDVSAFHDYRPEGAHAWKDSAHDFFARRIAEGADPEAHIQRLKKRNRKKSFMREFEAETADLYERKVYAPLAESLDDIERDVKALNSELSVPITEVRRRLKQLSSGRKVDVFSDDRYKAVKKVNVSAVSTRDLSGSDFGAGFTSWAHNSSKADGKGGRDAAATTTGPPTPGSPGLVDFETAMTAHLSPTSALPSALSSRRPSTQHRQRKASFSLATSSTDPPTLVTPGEPSDSIAPDSSTVSLVLGGQMEPSGVSGAESSGEGGGDGEESDEDDVEVAPLLSIVPSLNDVKPPSPAVDDDDNDDDAADGKEGKEGDGSASDSDDSVGMEVDERLYFGPMARAMFFEKYRQLAYAINAGTSTAAAQSSAFNFYNDSAAVARPLSAVSFTSSAKQRSASQSELLGMTFPSLTMARSPSVRRQSAVIAAVDAGRLSRANANWMLDEKQAIENAGEIMSNLRLEDAVHGMKEDFDATEGRASPRTQFLSRYLEGNISNPPVPIVIRHHADDGTLNLAHMHLGDYYIGLLNEVFRNLPRVSAVNVRANDLTDESMPGLIENIKDYPKRRGKITYLDLSDNKIDDDAGDALRELIGSRKCHLEKLYVCNADIDDEEVVALMDALGENETIVDLDISNNGLGAEGEDQVDQQTWQSQASLLAIVDDDGDDDDEGGLIGGPAIAAALSNNKVLRRIDLSGNRMRARSGAHFGAALGNTTSALTDINFAGNMLGDMGAEALAGALLLNASLTRLNLSDNKIGPQGCIMLASALRDTSRITWLHLGQNPVGDVGGRALLSTLNYQLCDREILMHGCTYAPSVQAPPKAPRRAADADDPDAPAAPAAAAPRPEALRRLPSLNYPTGRYALDMTVHAERTVAKELVRVATLRRGCEVKVEHKGKTFHLARRGPCKATGGLSPAELMGPAYGPWRGSAPRPRHPYADATAEEWMAVVDKLALVEGGGNVNDKQPWKLPDAGELVVDFTQLPRCSTPVELLNKTGLDRLVQLLRSHKVYLAELLALCQHVVVLETTQLAELLQRLSERQAGAGPQVVFSKGQLVEVFSSLLVCVRDASNVDKLVRESCRSLGMMRNMQTTLRSMFQVTSNALSGHWKLELFNNQMNRFTALRLAEINAEETAQLRRETALAWGTDVAAVTDPRTSQHDHRGNFRNELTREMLRDRFFMYGLRDKPGGVLEFDYVSTSRPGAAAAPVSNAALNDLLTARGLQDPSHGLLHWIRMDAAGTAGDPEVAGGLWLSRAVHTTADAVRRALHAAHCYSALTSPVSDADVDFIFLELQAGDAMYYLHEGFVHRYVVRLGVRVVSPPPPGLPPVLPADGPTRSAEEDDAAEAWAADDAEGADEDGFIAPPPAPAPAPSAEAGDVEGAATAAADEPDVDTGGPPVFLKESSRRCISVYGNAHDGDDGAHVDGDSAPPPVSPSGRVAAEAAAAAAAGGDSQQARRRALQERGEGTVLEMCCAYHVYVEKQIVEPPPEEGRGRFTRGKKMERKVEEVLVTRYQHKGSKVSAGGHFRPTEPFENLPMVFLLPEPHSIKPNMVKVLPTHERFALTDEVMATRSLLVAPINCREWMKTKEAELLGSGKGPLTPSERAKRLVATLLQGTGVRDGDLSVVDAYTVDVDEGARTMRMAERMREALATAHARAAPRAGESPTKDKREKLPFASADEVAASKAVARLHVVRGDEFPTDARVPKFCVTKVICERVDVAVAEQLGALEEGVGLFKSDPCTAVKALLEKDVLVTLGARPRDGPDLGGMHVVWRWRAQDRWVDVDVDADEVEAPVEPVVAGEGAGTTPRSPWQSAAQGAGGARERPFKLCAWQRRVNDLRLLAGRLHVTARQARHVARSFPLWPADSDGPGPGPAGAGAGTAWTHRMEAIVALFSRIVDLHNFDRVAATLPVAHHAALHRRVGWLNTFNVTRLHGRRFSLDLAVGDERRTADVLLQLAGGEDSASAGGGGGGGCLRLRAARFKADPKDAGAAWAVPWAPPAAWVVDGRLVLPTQGLLEATVVERVPAPDAMTAQAKRRRALMRAHTLLGIGRGDGGDARLGGKGESTDWDDLHLE